VLALTKLFFPAINKRRLGVDSPSAIAVLNAALKSGFLIAAVQGDGTSAGHAEIATLMRVSNPETSGGKMTVIMEPIRAVKITGYTKAGGVASANVSYIPTTASDPQKVKELASAAGQILHQFSHLDPKISQDLVAEALEETNGQRFVNMLSQDLPLSDAAKMELLAAPSIEVRLHLLVMELMGHFKAVSDASKPAAAGGDEGSAFDSPEAFKAKMDAIGMPADIQAIAKKEFDKLENMEPTSSEAGKIRTYLEWLTEMPWGQRTNDNFDIAAARDILNRDHAGLEKVKERVLEFLALRKKTGSKKGAILAFTGPPGVGKTSIAGAIAQALGRKFVRLSLGGVHDESVLRGHGRTYVGAMPGEIMRQMKNAGVVNPVMLLDEADKIGRNGNAGDPTAALLEVLDPAQNNTFRDRYLDVPYDLSEVLFVVTSNELSNIPEPLRDRMEIIEFDGYTTLEKMAIAETHVIPQKLESVGLKPGETTLTPAAIRKIIEGYTMEAGVRNLREKIETVLRKVSSWTETKGEKVPAVVDAQDVEKYLGVARFSPRQVAQNGVGVATGLAVNTYGGSTLNVEVTWEPGNGQLKLRKQFGDDIEDSAKNAYKYVKLNAAKYGLEKLDFTKIDLDINITPAGKVDGPSAGGLMVTAILSSLTGRAVTPGLAMTGEITARGDILPIGGLKQKVMAAHRMGYTEVIFPFANLKDIEDIPKEVRDGITLTAVKTYDEIYPKAVVKKATAAAAFTPTPAAPSASVPAAALVAPAARSWSWWNPMSWPIFNR
ncbi:MAG: endopeptidase La, partial [Elusimicrobiota bacterium]